MRDSKLDLEKANVGYFRWKLMWIPDVLKVLAGRLGRWFCWPLMTPVDLVPAMDVLDLWPHGFLTGS